MEGSSGNRGTQSRTAYGFVEKIWLLNGKCWDFPYGPRGSRIDFENIPTSSASVPMNRAGRNAYQPLRHCRPGGARARPGSLSTGSRARCRLSSNLSPSQVLIKFNVEPESRFEFKLVWPHRDCHG
eukprot:3399901-Rhodomonas_salina.2